jgi:hypothetical protein
MAVNHHRRDTVFVDVTCWEGVAEAAADHLTPPATSPSWDADDMGVRDEVVRVDGERRPASRRPAALDVHPPNGIAVRLDQLGVRQSLRWGAGRRRRLGRGGGFGPLGAATTTDQQPTGGTRSDEDHARDHRDWTHPASSRR